MKPRVPLNQMTSIGKTGLLLKGVFIWAILLWVFVSASISAYQEKDLGVFFVEVGEQTGGSLLEAQKQALEVQNGDFFAIFTFLWAFWKVVLWLLVFVFLVQITPWGNKAKLFETWSLAIAFYIIFQIIYLLIIGVGINTLFTAWGDIFRSFSYIISNKPTFDFVKPNSCTTSGGCFV